MDLTWVTQIGLNSIYLIMNIHMSRVMKKTAFCICENKAADQLCGNRTADHRLCFRYIDSTTPLLPKSEISSLWLYSPFVSDVVGNPVDRFSHVAAHI